MVLCSEVPFRFSLKPLSPPAAVSDCQPGSRLSLTCWAACGTASSAARSLWRPFSEAEKTCALGDHKKMRRYAARPCGISCWTRPRVRTRRTHAGDGSCCRTCCHLLLRCSGWWFGTFGLFSIYWEFHHPN